MDMAYSFYAWALLAMTHLYTHFVTYTQARAMDINLIDSHLFQRVLQVYEKNKLTVHIVTGMSINGFKDVMCF